MFSTIEIEKKICIHKASTKLLCIVAVTEQRVMMYGLYTTETVNILPTGGKHCYALYQQHFRGNYKITHNDIIVPSDSHTLLLTTILKQSYIKERS